jgi:hypothetical protein
MWDYFLPRSVAFNVYAPGEIMATISDFARGMASFAVLCITTTLFAQNPRTADTDQETRSGFE